MKKVLAIILLTFTFLCTGCEEQSLGSRAEQGFIEYEDLNDIVIADKETHIMYYKTYNGESAVMCPYYSKNGNLCKFEDGKIIEVNADEDSD